MKFDAGSVQELFGSFAAEHESPERFKDYFVTNKFFESFNADFPLRIVVGNKGSGKSALLRAAGDHDSSVPDRIRIPLTVTELVELIGVLPNDPLQAINRWKRVLATKAAAALVVGKISETLADELSGALTTVSNFVGHVVLALSNKAKVGSDIAVQAGLELNQVKSFVFYFDDLDKGWDGQLKGLVFVESLLNACFELSGRERNFKFKIALRWDLWIALSARMADIDKIRQSVVFLKWNKHEILLVQANIVSKALKIDFDYKRYLEGSDNQDQIFKVFDGVIEPVFRGAGHWSNAPMRRVILSMVRNRPRDLIVLLSLAAEQANMRNHEIIQTDDLEAIFRRYSEERLNDLNTEFGTRMSGLQTLLLSFRPSNAAGKAADKFRYSNDRIAKHVKDLLLKHRNAIKFTGETTILDYTRVVDFLYRIDFLQAWHLNDNGVRQRVNFEDRQLMLTKDADFGYSWEVLPTYRWALQPNDIASIFNSIEFSD
ncbi:MAG: hypothetical protein ING44_03730 [Telmatospirillum sp.]|nr:hypothetical protein [Telmatospirillum sp.]